MIAPPPVGDCEPVFVDCPAPGGCTALSCPCVEGALGDVDDDEWWEGGTPPPGRGCVDVIRDLSEFKGLKGGRTL